MRIEENTYKLYKYSKRKYYQFKDDHKKMTLLILILAILTTIVIGTIMAVFGFIDGLLKSMRPSHQELETRERMRMIAREENARAYGRSHGEAAGRQNYYDNRRNRMNEENRMSPIERLLRP